MVFALSVVAFTNTAVSAQDGMMKDDKMKDDKMMGDKMMKDDRPIVAMIYASWCPACRSVDPVISGLRKEYGKKLHFVQFDVSDEAKIAESQKKAASLGLEKFFSNNKTNTSTVAVIKGDKITYKTAKNTKRGDYEKAFAGVLK
jgi:thiol-disulfide isomerase/thioredoxin